MQTVFVFQIILFSYALLHLLDIRIDLKKQHLFAALVFAQRLQFVHKVKPGLIHRRNFFLQRFLIGIEMRKFFSDFDNSLCVRAFVALLVRLNTFFNGGNLRLVLVDFFVIGFYFRRYGSYIRLHTLNVVFKSFNGTFQFRRGKASRSQFFLKFIAVYLKFVIFLLPGFVVLFCVLFFTGNKFFQFADAVNVRIYLFYAQLIRIAR